MLQPNSDAVSYVSSCESDAYESGSEACSDFCGCSDSSDISSTCTFASLADALKGMTDHLAELDDGFECMESSVRRLERPAIGLAVATYSQPAVLEAAPFRHTRFRWRPDVPVKHTHETVSFTDVCARVRRGMLETGVAAEAFRESLGLTEEAMTSLTFLEALNVAMHRWVQ